MCQRKQPRNIIIYYTTIYNIIHSVRELHNTLSFLNTSITEEQKTRPHKPSRMISVEGGIKTRQMILHAFMLSVSYERNGATDGQMR